MSSIKEIKERMGGVRETKQITGAMYLVASTKLRHAREDLDRTRPYFDALRREIVRVFRADERLVSRYFYDNDGALPHGGVRGIVAITGDKGLCGGYNINVIRRTEALLKESPGAKLFAIGEYGRRYFQSHHFPLDESFFFSAQNPSLDQAREICTILLEKYDRAELASIDLVYTDMKSSISSDLLVQRLLPLERARFQPKEAEQPVPGAADFEFVPSQEAVVDMFVRSYLSGFLYSATVDSLCAEQNARVTAMDSAGRNAEKLLDEMSLQLNRERQSAITQEITEISAGAKAQRSKK